ncbi:ABC transporter ATP-binding protein [Solwaraspora sp. WMMD1047]|uniref:ABC transporter ATP-binding protein n=1 Tax=Solwaraspora sp. WMMD1047 TaxID=3016102 RepID=UPI00241788BC|nr:ABC transporter ATP-binding protein [Solwaraspora sp. WMMD1047]MDG4830569.1 ABC transporter ATP-binding protein [Solwaraspora sp. WMMD1047]
MSALLDVRGLRAGYAGSVVLHGVDVAIDEGSVLAILGRNGVGKSTLVMSLMGLVQTYGGSVGFAGRDLAGSRTDVIAAAGIALVPQGRRVFSPLSVEENLRVAIRRQRPGAWTLDRVYDLLPRLRERRGNRGNQLSGGEQQMLAIGRALLTNPRLLLLDEPSDGLSPMVVQQVADVIRALRADGITVLLVEQNVRLALDLADHVAVMVKGEIAWRTTPGGFRADRDRVRTLMSVGGEGTTA